MVYESYKHILKEEEQALDKQKPNAPIDYHVSIHNGKYYFNITISDKNLYPAVGNLRTFLINKLVYANNRDVIKGLYDQYGNDFVNTKEYKTLFAKYSSYFNLNKSFENGGSAQKDDNNPDAIIFNTPIKNVDDLYDEEGNLNLKSNDLIRIKSLLKEFGKRVGYDLSENDVENAVKSAFYGVKNMSCDRKEIEDDAKQLFFEVCKTIGSEETQKLLRTIQVGSQGYIFDSQLSLLNRLRVISQATKYDQNGGNQVQTISYLLTERQWRKSGRMVVDYNYPYHIVAAHKGREGKQHDWNKVKQLGYDSLDESFTADKHANKVANHTSDRNGYGYHTVYDVQATQPLQGYNDEWANEPALKNNITGELNDIAIARINAKKNGFDDTQDGRTEKLNNLFNTTDYEGVNTIYQAVCMANGKKPNISANGDVKDMIRETGIMIDEMITEKLTSFKRGGGHIALTKNFQPIIPIGRIIVQAIIGLPMDSAPAIEWAEEHKEITSALSTIVNTVSTDILNKKKEVMNIQTNNINEMVNLYAPMFVFEETFNNTLKLIKENAKDI